MSNSKEQKTQEQWENEVQVNVAEALDILEDLKQFLESIKASETFTSLLAEFKENHYKSETFLTKLYNLLFELFELCKYAKQVSTINKQKILLLLIKLRIDINTAKKYNSSESYEGEVLTLKELESMRDELQVFINRRPELTSSFTMREGLREMQDFAENFAENLDFSRILLTTFDLIDNMSCYVEEVGQKDKETCKKLSNLENSFVQEIKNFNSKEPEFSDNFLIKLKKTQDYADKKGIKDFNNPLEFSDAADFLKGLNIEEILKRNENRFCGFISNKERKVYLYGRQEPIEVPTTLAKIYRIIQSSKNEKQKIFEIIVLLKKSINRYKEEDTNSFFVKYLSSARFKEVQKEYIDLYRVIMEKYYPNTAFIELKSMNKKFNLTQENDNPQEEKEQQIINYKP